MDVKQKIQQFTTKTSNKKKLIVIYWPTASWKTNLSLEVAKHIDSEIVSTDSRQIFTGLDIGTGKIKAEEMLWITHHMIDIITPNINYSVWAFKDEAVIILEKMWEKWCIPILCGWTWLYIDSLIYDFCIPKIPADEELRQQLEEERLKNGNMFIWKKLQKIDPEYAKELHPNNHRYVIRGLEVKLLTWKSKLDFRENKILKHETLFINSYDGNREKLYENINKRVKQMFDEGLVSEVKNLLKKYTKDDFGLKTIWYKEVIAYLEWKISLEACIELVQKHNRNYAKRQITWFKKYENNINY